MNKSSFVSVAVISILLIMVVITTSSNSVVYVANENVSVSLVDPLEVNGGIPVNLQDQTTRAASFRMNQPIITNISLATNGIINSYNLTLSPGHGVLVGNTLGVLEQNGMEEIFAGEVLSIVNINTVVLDSPIPYNFSVTNSTLFTSTTDLSVDGSSSPEVFGLTNSFSGSVDITRFIINILDNDQMDDGLFGGLPELTRGVVLRKKALDGTYINYWNVKDNGEFGELSFDKVYDEKAPSGVFGLTTMITYGGQENHGVVIRLEQGESIEMWVQDDLTGLVSFEVMVEGHFTQE